MSIKIVLLIILAALVALGISYWTYFFKRNKLARVHWVMALLRFIGIFGLLLLLINPTFTKRSFTLKKPNLVVLVDNSESMWNSREELMSLVKSFKSDPYISNRFTVKDYVFGEDLRPSIDSLTLKDKQTKISKAIRTLQESYAREQTVFVLLSDGNQTVGQDFSFIQPKQNQSINTIVLGDTTKYADLSVGPINCNKYAFLNNKFPLESYVMFQGKGSVSANVSVLVNNKSVYTEKISLSSNENLKAINTLIDANSIGIKKISVQVTQLPSERNVSNNSRNTITEVIDEKTNIALVSQTIHPDMGTLKKAIEANEQRSVTFFKPDAPLSGFDDTNLFIFYQPTASFKKVMELAIKNDINSLIICGVKTDFYFLNKVQKDFEIENGYPEQEVFGFKNNAFSKFDISGFDIVDFPPLASNAGPIILNTPNEPLLGTTIRGLDIDMPMLTVWENGGVKHGLFMGENLWKWRMQTYKNLGDFENFDRFLGKLTRYLTGTKNKSRLNVNYETIYEGNNNAIITASFFDEALQFDENGNLSIRLVNTATTNVQTIPMVLKNEYFEADLTNLDPGDYDFKVSVANESISESGKFTISEFDFEQQFISSNFSKMQQLALANNGKTFLGSQYQDLVLDLTENMAYVPTEISTENVVSLIDFRVLLGLIAMAFAAEWFIRKYNGLI